MRVLVTGGAGFIGSAVCRHLVGERGDAVLNFDKLTYAANLASLAPIEASPLYRFQQGDVTDAAALAAAFEAFEPQAVIHMAAETHVDRSIDSARPFIEANILGVFTLLETAADLSGGPTESGGRRFPAAVPLHRRGVQAALGETGGLFDRGPRPISPSSPYSASKPAGDHIWSRSLGRAPCGLYGADRPTAPNNYGPCQFPEKLIPLMILNGLEGRPLPVYGQGDQVRDWLYVEDHARALALILARGEAGETYLVGGGGAHQSAGRRGRAAICSTNRRSPDRNGPRSAS